MVNLYWYRGPCCRIFNVKNGYRFISVDLYIPNLNHNRSHEQKCRCTIFSCSKNAFSRCQVAASPKMIDKKLSPLSPSAGCKLVATIKYWVLLLLFFFLDFFFFFFCQIADKIIPFLKWSPSMQPPLCVCCHSVVIARQHGSKESNIFF